MADEVYYSALHWAKKAEASAKQAADLSQTSGKVVQIGFDGTLSNSVLVFKHAPGGTEIPYELVDDVEYEVDLNYANTGSLADTVQIQIKNGSDTINLVSAIHRSSTTPATVGDMKAVMRFDSSTGYRWLFKAAYKITPAGAKVMLLYPVVYNDEAVKALQTADAQNVKLTGNQTVGGNKTFTGVITQQASSVQPIFKSTGYTKGTAPSGDLYMAHRIYRDNGNNPVFDEYYYIPKSTNRPTYILRMQNVSSASATGYKDIVTAWYDGTNSLYSINATTVTASTPATNSNGTNIATTAWVNTRISSIMNSIYPVGSLYLTVNSTCPLAALISGSTWELVSQDRVLQGAGTRGAVGTTLEAGLPDHRHSMAVKTGTSGWEGGGAHNGTSYTGYASEDNPIYGRSDTVQPPAYLINVFKRTK